jgi:hypothetical protein
MRHRIVLAFLGGYYLLAQSTIAATYNSQVVAMRGTAAPDGNGVLTYFGVPVINDAGQIAFTAGLSVTNGGSSDNRGVFLGDGVGLSQIARKGQTTPDGNGQFANFVDGGPALNNAGQVAFAASLSGTTGGFVDDGGVYLGDETTITQIAREGQTAPDGNGAFSRFFSPTLNSVGQVAVRGSLTGASGGGSSGIFRGDGFSLAQIVRNGQSMPGGSGTFNSVDDIFELNDSGQVSLYVQLTAEGIFQGDGDALITIVRAGQSTPLGVDIDDIGNFEGSNQGDVVFVGNPGPFSPSPRAIYRGNGGALATVVRDGQTSPDGNGKFSDFTDLELNALGHVAFRATLTETNAGPSDNVGVYRFDGSDLAFVAREGQAAPDGNGNFTSTFSRLAFNDAGQTAFLATLTGTSGGASDDRGVYVHDAATGLVKVVRTGDAFLGSTISRFTFSGPDHRDDGFNEAGQIAYYFVLADGRSGVAIASPVLAANSNQDGIADVAIPEPTSLLLFLAALYVLVAGFNRRR